MRKCACDMGTPRLKIFLWKFMSLERGMPNYALILVYVFRAVVYDVCRSVRDTLLVV